LFVDREKEIEMSKIKKSITVSKPWHAVNYKVVKATNIVATMLDLPFLRMKYED